MYLFTKIPSYNQWNSITQGWVSERLIQRTCWRRACYGYSVLLRPQLLKLIFTVLPPMFQSMVSYEQTQNKHINNNIYCYNTHTYDYYIFIEYILIINILKYYILLVSVILLLLSLYISCMVQADSWFGHFILRVKLYWLVKRNSLDNSFNILRGLAGWILTYYLPTLALQLRTPGQTHLIIHTLWGCGCLYCWGVQ